MRPAMRGYCSTARAIAFIKKSLEAILAPSERPRLRRMCNISVRSAWASEIERGDGAFGFEHFGRDDLLDAHDGDMISRGVLRI